MKKLLSVLVLVILALTLVGFNATTNVDKDEISYATAVDFDDIRDIGYVPPSGPINPKF